MNELISIVVTSYNHVEFLQQRMDSLLEQTYQNIEILVIDDASIDGSQDFLKIYERNPKVKLFLFEKNVGYVNASNFGVSMTQGEYIVFAECDDFAEPEQIELLFKAIKKQDNIGVSYCRSKLLDENNNEFAIDYDVRESSFKEKCKTDVLISGLQMQMFFLYSNVLPNMSAAIFKKCLFFQIGGLSSNFKLCADWDFWVRMAKVCDFYYVAKALNNFRFHVNSIRNQVRVSVQMIEIINIVSPLAREINISFKGKIRFKINLGKIWLSYALSGYVNFIKSIPNVLLNSVRQEPLLFFFLLLNVPVVTFNRIKKKLNF